MIPSLPEALTELARTRDELEVQKVRNAALEKALSERTEQLVRVQKQVTELQEQVQRLMRKLGQDSSNSSKPPSSDPPWKKTHPPKKGSGRKPGGQQGHEGSFRKLVPVDQVDQVHRHDPIWCVHCGACLDEAPYEGHPHRVQRTELPPVRAEIHEHRAMKKRCTRCGKATRAELPKEIGSRCFGPSVVAMAAYLMGAFRMSRRHVQAYFSEVWDLRLSLGALSASEGQASAALHLPYEQAHAFVPKQPVVHADETRWPEKNQTHWLWVGSCPEVRVFQIQERRDTEAAETMLGSCAGILTTDRLGSYNTHPTERRQVCWAHLDRDFAGLAQSQGPGAALGTELCAQTDALWTAWHAFRSATLPREDLKAAMEPVQTRLEALLEEGTRSECAFTSGRCKAILRMKAALWTFVSHEGVEPTNNKAERDLRPAVLLRKTSGGTQSNRGSRFVERMLTVVASLRAQKRNVGSFLRRALLAHHHGTAPPSLLPAL